MKLADLPAEEQRVCDLVREQALRCLGESQAYGLYLVGSRATGESWPTSDFDFVIDAGGPLPGKVINPFREALDHLRIPYAIDLVDWHRCSDAFRELAGAQKVEVG
jgi:predicted nucleotidyltransferase